MAKKLLKEEVVRNEFYNILLEDKKSQEEIAKQVKDIISNDRTVKTDLEKKVKEIVASCVNNLFRTLWQRHNFYEDEIKR